LLSQYIAKIDDVLGGFHGCIGFGLVFFVEGVRCTLEGYLDGSVFSFCDDGLARDVGGFVLGEVIDALNVCPGVYLSW
jgi:hypothetical protein